MSIATIFKVYVPAVAPAVTFNDHCYPDYEMDADDKTPAEN